MIIQYYLYKWNYSYEVLSNVRDSKVSGALSDAITNNFNIKIFASAEREYQLLEDLVEKRRKITRTKWFRAMIIRTTTGLLTIILEICIFFFAIQFRKEGVLSIGVFVLLQIYLFRTIDQMRSIGNIFRNLYQSFSQSAEMIEILDADHEVQDRGDKVLQAQQGTIIFNDVTFRYEENDNVFEHLSFKIKPGEKIALVGESGS
jgi:ATP-binding cassette subfamily B protein